MNNSEIHQRLKAARDTCMAIAKRNPQEQLGGVVAAAMSPAISAAKEARPDDPVVQSLVDAITKNGGLAVTSAPDVLAVLDQLLITFPQEFHVF